MLGLVGTPFRHAQTRISLSRDDDEDVEEYRNSNRNSTRSNRNSNRHSNRNSNRNSDELEDSDADARSTTLCNQKDEMVTFVETQARELREHRRCVVELLTSQVELLKKTECAIKEKMKAERGNVSREGSSPRAQDSIQCLSPRELGVIHLGTELLETEDIGVFDIKGDTDQRRSDVGVIDLSPSPTPRFTPQRQSMAEGSSTPGRRARKSMTNGSIAGGRKRPQESLLEDPNFTPVRLKEVVSMSYRASVAGMTHDSLFQRCKMTLISTWAGTAAWIHLRGRHEGLARCVGGVRFTCVIAALILCNAIYIGYSSDFHMRAALAAHGREGATVDQPFGQEYFDSFFTIAFALELLLRIIALGCEFFIGHDSGWNLFDTFLVISSLMEMVFASAGFDLTFLRVQRLLKMVRTFRILKIFRHFMIFRKLQTMVMAIVNSLIPLMWAMMLLLVVIFLFAVIFLLGVSDYISDAKVDDATVEEFRVYFETMQMTVLTLWMSVSGGVSWWEIERLLLRISWVWGCLLPFFMAVMLLAMMNIITGIFVNDAVEMMSLDRDLHFQLEQEKAQLLIGDLKDLFHQMDDDGSGQLSHAELSRNMQNEGMKTLLASAQLDVHDATSFFDILDVDENGVLEIDEFVMGAMYLKGHANMLDMAIMLRDNKKMMRKAFKLTRSIGDRVQSLERKIEKEFLAFHEVLVLSTP